MPVLVVGLSRGVLAVQLGLPSLRRQQHPERVPRPQRKHQIFQPPPESLRQQMPRKAGKERRAQPEVSSSPQRGPGLQVLTFSSTVDAGARAWLNHNHFLQ